jgi:hypothetical protein
MLAATLIAVLPVHAEDSTPATPQGSQGGYYPTPTPEDLTCGHSNSEPKIGCVAIPPLADERETLVSWQVFDRNGMTVRSIKQTTALVYTWEFNSPCPTGWYTVLATGVNAEGGPMWVYSTNVYILQEDCTNGLPLERPMQVTTDGESVTFEAVLAEAEKQQIAAISPSGFLLTTVRTPETTIFHTRELDLMTSPVVVSETLDFTLSGEYEVSFNWYSQPQEGDTVHFLTSSRIVQFLPAQGCTAEINIGSEAKWEWWTVGAQAAVTPKAAAAFTGYTLKLSGMLGERTVYMAAASVMGKIEGTYIVTFPQDACVASTIALPMVGR